MLILRHIDSKTLAALLLAAAQSYRTPSASKEGPASTAADKANRPCQEPAAAPREKRPPASFSCTDATAPPKPGLGLLP